MDLDTIAFFREICKTVKELAEISDRFLAREAAKSSKAKEDTAQVKTTPQNRLIPLCDWNKHHEWPTVAALRSYAFMRDRNGFDKVVSKVGKRLVIDEEKFFEWVRSDPKTLPPQPTPLSKIRSKY